MQCFKIQNHEKKIDMLDEKMRVEMPNESSIEQLKPNDVPNSMQSTKESEQCAQKAKIKNSWGQFSGELDDWRHFSKRFKSDVHENLDIASSGKLNLLKEACQCEVLTLISNAGNSYQDAWD